MPRATRPRATRAERPQAARLQAGHGSPVAGTPPPIRSGRPAHEPERVRAMFGAIAGRYDLLNRLLSLGLDAGWRRDAVAEAVAGAPEDVLDVATGTADVALGIKRALPRARVTGVDFSEPMLAIGRRKAVRAGLDVRLETGDAMALAYAPESFDVATIAYGLRNVEDWDAGLHELHRVLRPGGKVVILEFPPPRDGILGRLYRTYFLRVLPAVGGLVSGSPGAYAYLPRSVLAFPDPHALALRMHRAGFESVRYKLQSYGISALHVGIKPQAGPKTQESFRES